jgi:hypothetical protein
MLAVVMSPWVNKAQAMRAFLLAKAAAVMFR